MERKATSKGKRVRKTLRREVRSVDPTLMLDLLEELYLLAGDAATALGASPAQKMKAMKRAQRAGANRPRPSRTVLKNDNGVALLLGTWRRDPRYIQTDGTPKALPIHGSGATLERLAKFCVPELGVDEVVEILCTHSDVARISGGKVALLGHPVMITAKTPTTNLAWLITQMRHIAQTVVFNSSIPAKNAKSGGRFERQIWATLPKAKFEAWAQTTRKRLQETSDRVEAELEREGGSILDEKQKLCGIGLYIFRDDGEIG